MHQDCLQARKVVLFIVEGITEEASLGMIMQKLFKEDKIFFQIIHADITSDKESTEQNIIMKLSSEVSKACKVNYFYKNDILKIVHLVDLDGAFIPETAVLDAAVERAEYTEETIKTKFRDEMKKRNRRKSALLSLLSQCTQIEGIAYEVYYFSRNLEHVLHGEGDVPDEKKMDYADRFADRFYDYPPEFITFIHGAEFAVPGTYEDTWKFVQKGTSSLKRHCNFHLFFHQKS